MKVFISLLCVGALIALCLADDTKKEASSAVKESKEIKKVASCDSVTAALANVASCKYFATRAALKAAPFNATAWGVLCDSCSAAVKQVVDALFVCPAKVIDIIGMVNNDILELASAATDCAYNDKNDKLCVVSAHERASITDNCATINNKTLCLQNSACAWRTVESSNSQEESDRKVRTFQSQEGETVKSSSESGSGKASGTTEVKDSTASTDAAPDAVKPADSTEVKPVDEQAEGSTEAKPVDGKTEGSTEAKPADGKTEGSTEVKPVDGKTEGSTEVKEKSESGEKVEASDDKSEGTIQTMKAESSSPSFVCAMIPTEAALALLCDGCVATYAKVFKNLYEIWKKQRTTKPKGLARAQEAHTVVSVSQLVSGSVCKKSKGQYCSLLSAFVGERDQSAATQDQNSLLPADVEDMCSVTSPVASCLKAETAAALQMERDQNELELTATVDDKDYNATISSTAQDSAEALSQVCRKNNGKRCGQLVKEVIESTADAAWNSCKTGFGSGSCGAGCGDKLTQKIKDLGCCVGALNSLLAKSGGKDKKGNKMGVKSVAEVCGISLPEKLDECKKVKANKQSKIKFGSLSCAALSDSALVTDLTQSVQTDVAAAIGASPTDIADVKLVCDASTAPAAAAQPAGRKGRMGTLQSNGVSVVFYLTADDLATLDANLASLNSTLTNSDLALLDTTATLNGAGYDATLDYTTSEVGASGAEDDSAVIALESSAVRAVATSIMVVAVLLAALFL